MGKFSGADLKKMKKRPDNKPPIIMEKILQFLLPADDTDSLLGDYEELYIEYAETKGLFMAITWYFIQIIKAIPTFLTEIIYWNCGVTARLLQAQSGTRERGQGFHYNQPRTFLAAPSSCVVGFPHAERDESAHPRSNSG